MWSWAQYQGCVSGPTTQVHTMHPAMLLVHVHAITCSLLLKQSDHIQNKSNERGSLSSHAKVGEPWLEFGQLDSVVNSVFVPRTVLRSSLIYDHRCRLWGCLCMSKLNCVGDPLTGWTSPAGMSGLAELSRLTLAGIRDRQCRQCRDSKLRNKLALSFMWRTAHNLNRRKKGVVNTKQSAHTSILSRGLLSPQGCLGRLNFFKHHCCCLCMFLWSLSYGLTTRLWSVQFRSIQSSDLVPSTSEMSVANWLETKGSTSHWRAQRWLWVGHQEVLGSAPDLQLPLDCLFVLRSCNYAWLLDFCSKLCNKEIVANYAQNYQFLIKWCPCSFPFPSLPLC